MNTTDENKINVHHAYLPVTMAWKEHVRNKSVHDFMINDCSANIHPMICIYNEKPLLRQFWQDTIISKDDFVIVLHLPQGGGGGGSNPARIVLTIAVIALSYYTAGAAAPYLASLGAAAPIASAALSAAIMIGGTALINAILPVETDSITSNDTSASGTTSSTYSLSSPTNTSRIGDVIPVQYGRMRQTPALATSPWTEYDGTDKQWAYILLAIGQGYYDVEKIEFLNADIDTLDDVEYYILDPGEAVPWNDNVFTSPHVDGGEEITRQNNVTLSSVEISCFGGAPPISYGGFIAVGATTLSRGDKIVISGSTLNTGIYTVRSVGFSGTLEYATVEELFYGEHPYPDYFVGTISMAYTYSDTNDWPVKYRDDIEEYGRTIYCDVVFPNGLFEADTTTDTILEATVTLTLYATGDGDSSGSNAIAISEAYEITRSQREPVRVSLEGTLPSDSSTSFENLRVFIRRNQSAVSNYISDGCYWAGLRVIYDDIGSYDDITTVAIKVKASEGISGDALSKIRVTSTRMLPIYDTEDSSTLDSSSGTGWTTEISTRHIAWAIADCCRNRTYSVGRVDAELDIDTLLELHQTWMSRGDYCDGVFDKKTTFWDALTLICKTGRAQPILVGGKITFVRDQYQSIYKAVFTPRNITRSSFAVDYLMYDPDTPDDVVVEYFDGDTWSWKNVTCSLPGSSNDAPATIRKWGVSSEAQAEREGLYESACNLYRRTFITFETELEGRLVLRGQKISVSHPFPSWGVSGEIVEIDGRNLTLSEPIDWDSGSDHYIAFRDRYGEQDGPYLVDDYINDYEITLSVDPPSHLEDDINLGRSYFQFGVDEGYHKECLVVGARPRENGIVQLTCVVEDNQVHVADGTMDSSSGIF